MPMMPIFKQLILCFRVVCASTVKANTDGELKVHWLHENLTLMSPGIISRARIASFLAGFADFSPSTVLSSAIVP